MTDSLLDDEIDDESQSNYFQSYYNKFHPPKDSESNVTSALMSETTFNRNESSIASSMHFQPLFKNKVSQMSKMGMSKASKRNKEETYNFSRVDLNIIQKDINELSHIPSIYESS